MKKPFGFVTAYYVQEKVMHEGMSNDPNKRLEQVKEKLHNVEQNASVKFDQVS